MPDDPKAHRNRTMAFQKSNENKKGASRKRIFRMKREWKLFCMLVFAGGIGAI
jgi:hypothetical protein